MKSDYYQIFKKGSKTYFYSSWFFPKEVRDEVAILYTFVRVLDDLVDSVPQKKKTFYRYWQEYDKAMKGEKSKIDFIDDFVTLAKKRKFKNAWVQAFWKSMEMDLIKPVHNSLTETENYMYGSAEVIGLLMAKTMCLPREAYHTAQMLGKAMQYANFVRDIEEDWKMKRSYLQIKDRQEYIDNFLILKERFDTWQKEAEKGYQYLPKRYLVPIKTAAEMYKWTMAQIALNPNVVFEKKVKPNKLKILATGLLIGLLP